MNRIDRLFAILLELQHKRRVRAKDLARQFEISKRTVYRDMSALNQMGIPIASLPGEGFDLVEGFFLPPLMFNENEAIALALGLRLLTQQAAGSLTQSADSASAKIKVALPEQVRARSEALSGIIGFVTPSQKFNLDDSQLFIIQKAIQEKQVVHLRYHGYQKDEVSERDVEPYQLFYSEGVWYLAGYCRLRKDVREFRLSRVEKLRLRDEYFLKRRKSKLQSAKMIEVRIRFAAGILRWVHERQHYGFVRMENDGVTMVYHVHDVSEIKPWLLGWGAYAEALAPKSLRNELRETAQKLANLLT
jgi:predicted DNA-binding transcriptional regulator YafY